MDKVKKLVDAGATISGAIREVLSQNGLSITAFADKYERNRPNMTSVIAGSKAPTEDDIKALVAELGGEPEEWKVLLFEAGRPTVAS
jgi:plasmid maintenance system antidote protein VapI